MGMRKKIVNNLSCFIIFLLIAALLLSGLTWVLKGNGEESREDIIGFKNEKVPIDVVLFGASDLLRFYQPLEAWNEKGFTSYNYATSSATFDILKYFLEDSRKTNDAQLYVFDIANLRGVTDEVIPQCIRNWSDSLPLYSLTRLVGVTSYLSSRDWKKEDVLSYYLDICLYHTNYSSLLDKNQYRFLKQSAIHNIDKGFDPNKNHLSFSKPVVTDEIGELSSQQQAAVADLINYCDEKHLDVLFICSPIVVTDEDEQIFNAAGQMIQEHGYPYLDCNNYFDEIGLDFSTDFGDINHVNFLGAKKVTSFLIHYLSENYDLPDHRSDSAYSQWAADFSAFQQDQQQWEKSILETIEDQNQAVRTGEELCRTEDADKWLFKAQNPNFTILVEKNTEVQLDEREDYTSKVLKGWGADAQSDFVAEWLGNADNMVVPTPSAGIQNQIGASGRQKFSDVKINGGANPCLIIDGKDYLISDQGINLVVFDNNNLKVVDSICLLKSKKGFTIIR